MTGQDTGASLNTGPYILIVALGQEFRRDDAAGIRAVQAWLDMFPGRKDDPGICIEIAGLPGLNLLSMMEGYQAVILVDAMKSSEQPGTIQTVQVSDLAAFSSSSSNGHGWGAAETILLGHQLMPEKMPRQLVLIGIEAGDVGEGLGLTGKVEAALSEAATAIEVYVRNLVAYLAEHR